MDDVRCPHEVHDMGRAVPPVVEEIDADQSHDPGPRRTRRHLDQGEVAPDPEIAGEEDRLEEQPRHLLPDAAAQVRDGVMKAVDALSLPARHDELEPDEDEEDRDGDGDIVDHLTILTTFAGQAR